MLALVVDDDETSLVIIEHLLRKMGYDVLPARNGLEALALLADHQIHLVITDWDMPEMSGIDLCKAVRKADYAGYVYIIMVTANNGDDEKLEGLMAGADAFLAKPLKPAELLVCLKTAERILALETCELAIFALARLAESRDADTGKHLERVQKYARLLAQQLASTDKYRGIIDDGYIRLLHQTAPLHDIGKVGIPDAVLLKPGRLDAREMAIMRNHAAIGARTLDDALQRFPNARFLRMAREIAAAHHERFDGMGYPAGLKGEDIPLCARIVAIADVYDALTTRRVYKPALPHEQARAMILAERGGHFDPSLIDAFVVCESQFATISASLRDESEGAPPAFLAAASAAATLATLANPTGASITAGLAACHATIQDLSHLLTTTQPLRPPLSTSSSRQKD